MLALVAIRDPLTGETRLLVGDDNGVFTGTDQGVVTATGADTGVTTIQSNVGTAQEVTGSRNGNLQIAEMVDSAAQPSSLAANIAGSLFYGESRTNGFPASTSSILGTGNLDWTGENTAGSFLGNGDVHRHRPDRLRPTYQDRWANTSQINQTPNLSTDFFLVTPPQGLLTSRTAGLDNPINTAQWPTQGGSRFAVNPIDPTALVISSQTGAIYRSFGPSVGTGVQWSLIGNSSLGQLCQRRGLRRARPDLLVQRR